MAEFQETYEGFYGFDVGQPLLLRLATWLMAEGGILLIG